MQPVNLEHALAREFRFLKTEIQVAFVREALARRKLCRRLNLRLHHRSLRGLVAETFNDAFKLFLFALLVFLSAHGHFFFFGNRLAELFDRSLDLAHLVAVNTDRMRADLVHKVVVMRNQKHFAFPRAQKTAEPTHGDNVQIVRRFVQQEHVRLARQHLRQIQTNLETARQKHRTLVHALFVKTETEQNRLDLVFFEPAVFIHLEHAARFFVNRRMRKVDVLLQIANRVALGNVNVTTIDAFLAKNHLEKGRFTATIAPDKANAFVVRHKHARTVQKDLHAKRFRNVLYLNHSTKIDF